MKIQFNKIGSSKVYHSGSYTIIINRHGLNMRREGDEIFVQCSSGAARVIVDLAPNCIALWNAMKTKATITDNEDWQFESA